MIDYLVSPGGCLQGEIAVPGDKSISHRSVILGSIGLGVTEVTGLLEGMDVLATIHAFREMGVFIDGPRQGSLAIHGNGLHGLKPPKNSIDLGNSGTSMRLLTGLLSAQAFDSHLVGDESLNCRPMMRVVEPLSKMGAKIRPTAKGTPPVYICGGQSICGQQFKLNVASAQVKSAILLAGLYANSPVTVVEPTKTRDHSERMLSGMGCEISTIDGEISLVPPEFLHAKVINVPADISSATFFIVGATIAKGSKLTIRNVGINPTRTGAIDILKLMGADIHLFNQREAAGEPIADIQIHSAQLKGIEVPQELVAAAIDEFPSIVIAAASAAGKTVITGAKELRVKESDRIASMVKGLTNLGINSSELPDGMIVEGGQMKGGIVESYHDHRISMSFAMAGLISNGDITIKDCQNVSTSFPGFDKLAIKTGIKLHVL